MFKKLSKKNLILILSGSAMLLVLIVVLFTTIFKKDAELYVLVAPSTATIKIDGHKVKNGRVPIRSGEHKVVVSADGLETKEQSFTISKGETKSLNLYLTGQNNSFDYYKYYPDEIENLSLVADSDEAAKAVSKLRHIVTIRELLPYTIGNDSGRKTTTLSLGTKCSKAFCLKETDENTDMQKQMREEIKSLGYNADDYEIIYERTDTVEAEEE